MDLLRAFEEHRPPPRMTSEIHWDMSKNIYLTKSISFSKDLSQIAEYALSCNSEKSFKNARSGSGGE